MIRLLAAFLVFPSVLPIASAQTPNVLTPKEKAEGYVLLFDGKSLQGWDHYGAAGWKVADGAIVGEGDKAGWLGSAGVYGDFTLRAEFRTAADGNSGIFLRSAKEGQPHITGYELQIYDTQPAGFNTGSLVGAAKAPSDVKIVPGTWNRYEVTARGAKFVIHYNGRQVLEVEDGKSKSGVIGLQFNPGKKIEFRNLRIKPLK